MPTGRGRDRSLEEMRSLLAATLGLLLLASACGSESVPSAETDGPPSASAATTGAAETGGEGKPSTGQSHRPREELNADDMSAAKAAVKLGPLFLPGWREVEPTPDTGSQCTTFNPDLSKYTITGKARSAMKSENGARIEFSVKIYANAGQAGNVFAKSTGRRDLRCIREGVAAGLREAGFGVPVVRSEILHEPPVGAETVIYAIYYELEHPSVDTRQPYPVEVYVFRTGRVVGAAFFSFIADKASELRHARVVEGRLRGV
jgi:hypothetical protein